MPFCTACGKQNPDDARFCSQCGTRIAGADDAAPAADAPGESTATITFGDPPERPASRPPRRPTASSAPATPPRSTRCPPGSALLVVQRGPGAGNRFLLDTDLVTAGRHPDSEIFLDDVTVSRRHAEFRRTGDGFTRLRRRQPQRHLRQPRPHRRRRPAATATRCRSASTASSSSPGTRAAEPMAASTSAGSPTGRARMNIGQVLDQLRAGLPGHHHPQDPVPRGQGADQARAHPVGLPQVLRRRRRPAALHPAACSATTTCRSR